MVMSSILICVLINHSIKRLFFKFPFYLQFLFFFIFTVSIVKEKSLFLLGKSMQIMTSYFYQVRFMKPNMIPLSTALSDPQWFHKGTYDKTIQFKDKNSFNLIL